MLTLPRVRLGLTSALVAAGLFLAPSAAAHGGPPRSTPSAGGLTPSAPTTISGPTSPTTNEPGDNEPALVLTGLGVGAAALVGGWFVARRRVRDDVE